MLGLTLRKEFQGRRLKGTAIELANEKKTGATQIPARDLLDITYPTGDLLKSLETIGARTGPTSCAHRRTRTGQVPLHVLRRSERLNSRATEAL
jgi:hypothetical protein